MPFNDPPRNPAVRTFYVDVPEIPTPGIGRIVHYVSHGSPVLPDGTQRFTSECRAAIITAVEPIQAGEPDDPDAHRFVSIAVLNPTGMFFQEDCQHDEAEKRGGSWHWPERVSPLLPSKRP